ncbi:serine hydrolase [Proteobacteria bacterium 005FR1]|nr:serine hydrolase [Proteobacteria bacterium 005FR1]
MKSRSQWLASPVDRSRLRAFCLGTFGCSLFLIAVGLAGANPASAATAKTSDAKPAHAGLQSAVTSARRLPRIHSLLVAREGESVIEEVFAGPALDEPVNIKSIAKTIISALVGKAIEQGIIRGVEQPITELLDERVPEDATPGVEKITVGNLLALQAGLRRTSGPYYGAWVNSENWVAHILTRPFVAEPGGDMLYSTGSSHLLSAALTDASGRSTLELARDWLGEPLDLQIPPWTQDPQGIYLGGNQMWLSPRGLLRFGEMYRGGGIYKGQRVLPETWIETSWQPRGRSPHTGHLYGYGWFINQLSGEMVYSARGFGGQMLYVIPGLGTTVVITAETSPPSPGGAIYKRFNEWVGQELIPALTEQKNAR